MKVHTSLETLSEIKNAVGTTGSFDGVHVGHRFILNRLNEIAATINGESVLITFHPHPRKVLHPKMKIKLINTQEEKIKILEQTGLNHLVIIEFTREFAKTSPVDFIRNIIVGKLNAKKVIIGYDHNFGANREGDFEYLYELGKYYGFEVEEISVQDVNHVSVSSTKIRRALEIGQMHHVNDWLGHKYMIVAPVKHGSRLGRRIGFKTANIKIEDKLKLLPGEGVYAVSLVIEGEKHKGMLNIGRLKNPYENAGKIADEEYYLQLHILDFDQEIYDKTLTILLEDRIREERHFISVKSLVNQLNQDKKKVEELLMS